MKTCSKCKKEKPLKDFYAHKYNKDGLRGECKICQGLRNKAWSEANPEKRRAIGKLWRISNPDKVRAWYKGNSVERRINLYKKSLERRKTWLEIIKTRGMDKCSLCGYNKSFIAIDFHHIDQKGKESNVSHLMNLTLTPARLKELDKCIALCSNCHRVFHYLQRESLR